ncbi:TonB-dependent receptor [Pedobacter polaris]|uniref:TonB-dependent receptor n=1 Tax=Pedobacter polaris TaxID=2571273 RepID=A0A4U1CSW4_9SPHI|nr:TonB-dependent receptor [Pedobacter polaris]TKC10636.1 TonB-dependent receptor [Pedobacter polaris]
MKIKPILISFFVFFLAIQTFVSAQDQTVKIVESLQKFSADRPQEKVHLHFDKPYYAAGDTIWFKAYVVNAKLNMPSNISKTLNVTVVNDKDSVLFQQKIQLNAGLGNGHVAIPIGLKKGNFVVYAFTNWMRNFDQELYFKKPIIIENPFEQNTITNVKKPSNIQFSIFPESGDLVMGIRSKVAFKCIDENGLGKKVKGYIINKSNEKIIEFESNQFGMGVFALAPSMGEVYTAVYEFNGLKKETVLPQAKDQGFVMLINTADSTKFSVRISVSPQFIDNKELILVAQSGGEVYYASKFTAKQIIQTTIAKNLLPTGVTQITLFNSSNQPLVERLVFNDNNDNLKISIIADKKEYNKRERIDLKINILGVNEVVAMGSYSVSVTDETKVPYKEDDEVSILSNLLLTSDLKGYVEKPNYYFNHTNTEASKNLDYLMLTQGWRRFKWSDVMSNTSLPLAYKVEKGIDISGSVTTNSGLPIVNGKVLLFSGKGASFTTDTITNSNGIFSFDGIGFTDSTTFGLQARNASEKKNVKIKLNENKLPSFKSGELLKHKIDYEMDNYVLNSKNQYQQLFYSYNNNKELQLKQVEIKGVKKVPGIENSTNLNGPGNADKVISAEMLSASFSLFDYLKNYINGIVEMNDSIYFTRNMGGISSEGPAPVQFVLNGTFVTPDFIREMNVDDIQTVEVLRSAALTSIYGLSGGFGGVIIVTAKQGKARAVNQYAPGIITFMPKGYDVVKEFYSPKYLPAINNPKPDLRSTIYWNPNVIIDKDNKKTLNYFNADGLGTYKVVVEGINADGKVGRSIFNYTVK